MASHKIFLVSNADIKVIASARPWVKSCSTVTTDMGIFMFFYQIKYYIFFKMTIEFSFGYI